MIKNVISVILGNTCKIFDQRVTKHMEKLNQCNTCICTDFTQSHSGYYSYIWPYNRFFHLFHLGSVFFHHMYQGILDTEFCYHKDIQCTQN